MPRPVYSGGASSSSSLRPLACQVFTIASEQSEEEVEIDVDEQLFFPGTLPNILPSPPSLPPPIVPSSSNSDAELDSDAEPDQIQAPNPSECFAVENVSAAEVKMRCTMCNCFDVARMLDNRQVLLEPLFLAVHWNPRDDGTYWLALSATGVKCLDKKVSFRMLEGHVTIGYPKNALWAASGKVLVQVVKDWIRERRRCLIPNQLNGKISWTPLPREGAHERFVCLAFEAELHGGAHYWLRELSRRLWDERRDFPTRQRFHLSILPSNETLCEFLF